MKNRAWYANKFAGTSGRWLAAAAMLGLAACSLKESDTAVIQDKNAFRTIDGQTISRPEFDDYNPYVLKVADNYLVAVFASDRTCAGCTAGKHHIFLTKSATPYGDNGILPLFNIPQALTVAGSEQQWDNPVAFAATKTTSALRIYMNNGSGDIVYADITSGNDASALTDINNSNWKTQKIIGVAAGGAKIFARSAGGQIYLFDPSASDTTLTPMNSSQGSNSIVHLNPQHVRRQDAFFSLQGNQVQSASYMSMGGGVNGLNIALANSRIAIRNMSILYNNNRPGELVFLSGTTEGNQKQDMFIVEGAPPALLWDQTFPKPGEQIFNPGGTTPGNFMTFQPANLVLGSANFTSQGAAGSFDIIDIEMQNGIIYLAQKTGGTLRVYNLPPNVNNAASSYNLTGYNGGVAVDNGTIIRTSNPTGTNDLNFFNPIPNSGGAFPAATFTQGTATAACTQSEFANTNEQIEAAAGKLLLPDRTNNRVMVWNAIPFNGTQFPNLVLGQPNFTTCTAGTTATTLNLPGKPWTNGQRLAIADTGNNRVLIWNTFPTTSGQAADIILGQPNATTGTANTGGASASSLNQPLAVSSDGNRFAVLDSGNHRVLIWNNFPTANNQPANAVLGQNDFVHITANDDNQDNIDDNAGQPASGRVFKNPKALFVTPNTIFVSDFTHERVLIFVAQP